MPSSIAVQPSGTGWVGWVVLAVIVAFLVLTLIGDVRRGVWTRIGQWRTRRPSSGPRAPDGDGADGEVRFMRHE